MLLNLVAVLPLLGSAFAAPVPAPILDGVLAPVTGVISPVTGVTNGVGAVQGNGPIDIVNIVTNLKNVVSGAVVGANLDVVDNVVAVVDTCASVLNNVYTQLGVNNDINAPVDVHDLVNLNLKRDVAVPTIPEADFDLVADLIAEVVEHLKGLVGDLTDEIELDETVDRVLSTLDDNIFLVLGSLEELVPGILKKVGDLLGDDLKLDSLLDKVADLLEPLLGGTSVVPL